MKLKTFSASNTYLQICLWLKCIDILIQFWLIYKIIFIPTEIANDYLPMWVNLGLFNIFSFIIFFFLYTTNIFICRFFYIAGTAIIILASFLFDISSFAGPTFGLTVYFLLTVIEIVTIIANLEKRNLLSLVLKNNFTIIVKHK